MAAGMATSTASQANTLATTTPVERGALLGAPAAGGRPAGAAPGVVGGPAVGRPAGGG